MNNNYEHYTMRLTTLSPVFIGDGKELLKKEYVMVGNTVKIPDMEKVFHVICERGKDKEFVDFLISNDYKDLGKWLEYNKIKLESSFIKYQFDIDKSISTTSGGRAKQNSNTLKNIKTFIKDSYGNPYVPGSSIKGMIRTALLAYFVHQWKNKRIKEILECLDGIEKGSITEKGKDYLERRKSELEQRTFHTLKRDKADKELEERMESMLNSVMQGLIVSDSEPLKPSDLMLAQKIDYTLKGKEKGLSLYREALKPKTEILFSISIDLELCKIPLNTILVALRFFNDESNKHFYSHFKRENREVNTVYLGGGVGFLSKTILYPIFQEKGLEITQRVFKNTLSPKIFEEHHHEEDIVLGVSPHVCKCTRYNGRLYNMGICKIKKDSEDILSR